MAVQQSASDYDCSRCTAKYCDEDGELPESLGPAPFPAWELEGVGELYTCPLPMITPMTRFLLEEFTHYKAGNLWVDGGTSNQPSVYREAMRIISNASPSK